MANGGSVQKQPREVLADRIEKWQGTDRLYFYVDTLLNDLDIAGWDFQYRSCVAEGCTVELGAHCERHGYLLFGQPEAVKMERTEDQAKELHADLLAVLTVYDEHVSPENRGPWRDRLAKFADDLTVGVMDRVS